jgi:hypothetical protein
MKGRRADQGLCCFKEQYQRHHTGAFGGLSEAPQSGIFDGPDPITYADRRTTYVL